MQNTDTASAISETGERLLQAARRLHPDIAAARSAFDRDRRLPDGLVQAMAEAGLYALWLPRSLGGAELPPLAYLRIIEALAYADGAVGWCATIAAGTGRLAGSLGPEVAAEIFGGGRTIAVCMTNPAGKAVAVNGGYRVNGRWPYASFVGHSSWAAANCVLHDAAGPVRQADGAPALRMVFLQRQSIEVLDTWHVGGLRGTGSHDFTADGVLVPERHVLTLRDASPPAREAGPLYILPLLSAFVLCIAAVPLGIARAAIDAAAAMARTRLGADITSRVQASPALLIDLARAEALLRAGRAYLTQTLQALWLEVTAGRTPTPLQRAELRLACWHSTQCCLQAVDLMYAAAGGAALYETQPLERCFRDIHAAAQHMALASANLEPLGRVLLESEQR